MKLFDLLQVSDVVSMHVQSLELREVEQLFVNVLEVVVGEIDPLEILWLPHDVVEDVSEALYCADLIVVQEQRCAYSVHSFLARALSCLP